MPQPSDVACNAASSMRPQTGLHLPPQPVAPTAAGQHRLLWLLQALALSTGIRRCRAIRPFPAVVTESVEPGGNQDRLSPRLNSCSAETDPRQALETAPDCSSFGGADRLDPRRPGGEPA